MLRRLERWVRVVTTGSSFALFGLACLVVGLGVIPLAQLGTRDPETRQLRSQRLIQLSFRFFIGYMKLVRAVEVEIHGAEALRRAGGGLVVANHPTLLDVVMLGALSPQLDCVVKREAWSNPFMKWVVEAAGYIPNNAGEELVEACAERLRRGRRLLIFPEGTRSPRNALGPFQRGFAHVALRSGLPLQPVLISCRPPSLMRGQKWYEVPERRMRFTIEICEPMDLGLVVEEGDSRGTAARKVTAALRDFYGKKLHTLAAQEAPDAFQERDLQVGDGSPEA